MEGDFWDTGSAAGGYRGSGERGGEWSTGGEAAQANGCLLSVAFDPGKSEGPLIDSDQVRTPNGVTIVDRGGWREGAAIIGGEGELEAGDAASAGDPGGGDEFSRRREGRAFDGASLDFPVVAMKRIWRRPLAIGKAQEGDIANLARQMVPIGTSKPDGVTSVEVGQQVQTSGSTV